MSLALVQWIVEALLLLGLAAALPAAYRLERALSALKRDRVELSDSVRGFAEATKEAEAAIARLRATADGAGRSVAEQVRIAGVLREDLKFLTERAEQLAERLDGGLRAARPAADPAMAAAAAAPVPRARAEADLLRALRRGRGE
jgi:enamine deaminase RidA (YjgF/YER057c/UK114 family)